MQYQYGDIVEAFKQNTVDVIAHQANCFNRMGRGVAKAIKNTFPEASLADNQTKAGDKSKLGTYTVAETPYGFIYNLYGQYMYGYDGKQRTDYAALFQSLKQMRDDLISHGFSGNIGLPKLGCGLGGGEWSEVSKLIENSLCPHWNVIIFEF